MYEILDRFKGETLKGKKYQPLFPYFTYIREERENAFRILTGTFVTTDQGTGVVHQAPYFGEVLVYFIDIFVLHFILHTNLSTSLD